MAILSLVTMLFIGVNLDFFLILLLLLQKYRSRDVLIGYELGMLVVFTISATVGQLIHAMVPEWGIGFLGIVPIIMAIKGEGTDHDEQKRSNANGILAVMLMYLVSCGADNIAVYVPVLATMGFGAILLTVLYFIALTFISLLLAAGIAKLPVMKQLFARWGGAISRVIYAWIGLFVFWDTGLISKMMTLF